jgi:hypothetical protein
MQLTFLGKQQDCNKELEVFSEPEHEFGFIAKVIFKQDSWYEYKEVFYTNLTEVHFRYNDVIHNRSRVAFESDIHRTGCTKELDDIESIEVTKANMLYSSYFAYKVGLFII